MRMSRMSWAAGAAAGAMIVAGCGAISGGDGEVTLTFASYVPETTAIYEIQSALLDEIEDRSDGRIEFDRFFSASLCSAEEALACVQDGRADLGYTITSYYPGVFTASDAAVLPFVWPTNQSVTEGFHQLYDETDAVRDEWDAAGVVPLLTMPSDRLFIGAAELVASSDDLRGMAMRVTGDSLSTAFAEVGTNVTPLAPPEIYEAIERGTLDGWASNFDFIFGYSIDEVTPHIADPGVGSFALLPVVMNGDVLESLDDDLQDIIREVSAEFVGGVANETYNELQRGSCDELIDRALIEDFVQWSEADVQAWRDATWDDIVAGFKGRLGESGLSDADADELIDLAETIAQETPGAQIPDATIECADRYTDETS